MLSSRFAGIPVSSSTIDGPGLPRLLISRGASEGSLQQLKWPVSFRNGGRLHFGAVADIKSESVAGLRRNSHKLEEAQNRSNCQTLFGIARIPTDNHIRAILDEIDPAGLEPVFMDTVGRLEAAGALTKFQALDERLMVAFDGTQYFNSTKIHCPHCLIRVHNRGKDDEWTEYYHTAMCATLVGQGHNLAVPLMPEFIANDEPGAGNGRSPNKQDCEINATKRWLAKHGETLARYRPIALADALSACQPMLQAFSEHGWSYIVTALPSDLKTLYDFIEGGGARHVG